MTSGDKLRNVESQAILIGRGEINTICCPYCDSIVAHMQPFCCKLLAAAVNAVLDRIEMEEKLRMAEEIAYRAAQEPKPLVTIN